MLCSDPYPITYPTLEPGWWERSAGSQQCSLALIGVTRQPGGLLEFVWHPIISGSSKGLRDEGGQGHRASSFQANHSAGLITIPTRCSFQWWSVPLWSMLHSLTLLFLRLPELYHVALLRHLSLQSPAGLLPGCYNLRSVTFCSVADKAVIIWDNREKKKKTGKICQSSFLSLFHVEVIILMFRGYDVHNCIICLVCSLIWIWHFCIFSSAVKFEYDIVSCRWVKCVSLNLYSTV